MNKGLQMGKSGLLFFFVVGGGLFLGHGARPCC